MVSVLVGEQKGISIRTPTRGATIAEIHLAIKRRFQSALPRGERQFFNAPYVLVGIFQSALPRGERQPASEPTETTNDISIRTPTRGATRIHGKSCGKRQNFNPHSHEGSDVGSWILRLALNLFQSALPRGERLVSITSQGTPN